MDEKQTPDGGKEPRRVRDKSFYIRIAIICAVSITAIILIVCFDSIAATLGKFFAVLMPVFYGFLIAYLCNPLYKLFFEKAFAKLKSVHWRKILSLLLTYIIVFLVIIGLLFVIVEQSVVSFQNFISHLDEYVSNAEGFIIGLINGIPFLKSEKDLAPPPESSLPDDTAESTAPADTTAIPGDTTVPDVTTDVEQDGGEREHLIDFNFTKEDLTRLITNFFSDSQQLIVWASGAVEPIIQFFTNAGSTIFNILIGFIFSIYILAEKDSLGAKAKKMTYALFKKERADRYVQFASYSNRKIGHFIKGKLLESIIVGVMAYVLFLIFGIPSPLMVAMLVAIMNIIPIFGPFLGAIPAAVLVLIMDPSKTIAYIIIIIVIMQINGNYISPKIVGSKTGLTSLGAITALLLMSGYFGLIGMFIGIPVCAVLIDTLWIELDERLAEKNMSTNIDHYYSARGALVLEEERARPRKRNLTALVVDSAVKLFNLIFRRNKTDGEENDTNTTSNDGDEKHDGK